MLWYIYYYIKLIYHTQVIIIINVVIITIIIIIIKVVVVLSCYIVSVAVIILEVFCFVLKRSETEMCNWLNTTYFWGTLYLKLLDDWDQSSHVIFFITTRVGM